MRSAPLSTKSNPPSTTNSRPMARSRRRTSGRATCRNSAAPLSRFPSTPFAGDDDAARHHRARRGDGAGGDQELRALVAAAVAELPDLRHLEGHVLRLDAAVLVVERGGAGKVDAAGGEQEDGEARGASHHLPQRQRGGSPFSQQMTMSSALSSAT